MFMFEVLYRMLRRPNKATPIKSLKLDISKRIGTEAYKDLFGQRKMKII